MRFNELVKSARPFALAGLAAASLAMGEPAMAADFCHKIGDSAGRQLGKDQIKGGSSSLNGMIGQVVGKITATMICGQDQDALQERQREAERLAERQARDEQRKAKKMARSEREIEERIEREVEARMRAREHGQGMPVRTAHTSGDAYEPSPVATAGPAPVYEVVRGQVLRVDPESGKPMTMQQIANAMEEDMRRAHEAAKAAQRGRLKM